MTALRSPETYYPYAAPVTALDRAERATLDYCTTTVREQAQPKLRDLSPLDVMYAYFGSDETR
ncbi:hypothetical protein [Pseudotabrizicola formosa]|uniref:hypothetical protein n=1 Tax=Pseudotabrizicola formosa TaxID=2030009 RepID=UPI000CD20B74|nr:hypothetical protein [Pseudotabrizicola formosa]